MQSAVCSAFVLLVSGFALASSPNTPDNSLTTFRVTTAEVHVDINAVNEHNQPVPLLSPKDFELLRDGHPVQQVLSFERRHQEPLSVLVLTDVSDSMTPGIPLERQAETWLRDNSDIVTDHVSFLDFGLEVRINDGKSHNDYLTSLYDSAYEIIPRIAIESGGVGRRALILLTDGGDNSSLRSLDEVVKLAQKYDVAIYAITAAPSKKQEVEEEILTSLTAQTGGRFYHIRKSNEMLAAITEVTDELRNSYELILRADAQAGIHRLDIRSHRKLRFFYRTAYYQSERSRALVQ